MKMYLKYFTFSLLLSFLLACKEEPTFPSFEKWEAYDETELLDKSQQNNNPRLRYKLIQSRISDKNELLNDIKFQLAGFTEDTYQDLASLIYEKSILEIQAEIDKKNLSYKQLTQWYLYRIAKIETNKKSSLNAIISINPNAVEEAEKMDQIVADNKHPIYGMPILLKDNINTKNMKTTAGAAFLGNHQPTENASIVQNLIANGAIILGKANLSEWANYLCDTCPNGYSAIGGQTLNPYGIRKFDTGGSSSGSAASVAANYAVAAVGSETSGSILSPSSQQSLVGLKPTIGKLSQNGIVPISSTLDTPGPITKYASDNSILYDAMRNLSETGDFLITQIENPSQFRLGVFKSFKQDSLYNIAIESLLKKGFHIEWMEPEPMNFSGFLELLNGDMKRDLTSYFNDFMPMKMEEAIGVEKVVSFNLQDTLLHIPYGQARLDGILAQDFNDVQLDSIRQKLINAGKTFFSPLFERHQLDAVLSINNFNAGQAAVAKYPAITLPMGYDQTGEPKGLTFIAEPNHESLLFQLAHFFEQLNNSRIPPQNYQLNSLN